MRNDPHGRFIAVRERFPSLDREGIAVEFFAAYVNEFRQPHAVDVVLLTYVARGEAQHAMGGTLVPVRAGSLGITHYGQEHDLLTGPAGIEVYNVYLDLTRHALPPLPMEFQGLLPEILPLHPTFQNLLNRRVHLQFDRPAEITPLLARMARETASRELGAGEVLRSCFRILLVECCRQYRQSGRTAETSGPAVAWLERLRRHIDFHYREPLTLADLAAVAGVNPSYLSRAFKRYTGKGLVRYLGERRLQAALLQLRASDAKVAGVALDCGFTDLAWFNRRFREQMGCTPTQYRQRTRG